MLKDIIKKEILDHLRRGAIYRAREMNLSNGVVNVGDKMGAINRAPTRGITC